MKGNTNRPFRTFARQLKSMHTIPLVISTSARTSSSMRIFRRPSSIAAWFCGSLRIQDCKRTPTLTWAALIGGSEIPIITKASYDAALGLAPQNPTALMGMGLLAQSRGDFPEAIREYSQTVAVQASDVAYLLLARALEQTGRVQEARAARDEAGHISSDISQAERNVDHLLTH